MGTKLVVKIINNQYGFSSHLIKICNYIESIGHLENQAINQFIETLYNYYSSWEDKHIPKVTIKNDTITIIHELWCDVLLTLKVVPIGYRVTYFGYFSANSSGPYRPENLIISQNQVIEIIKQMMDDDTFAS